MIQFFKDYGTLIIAIYGVMQVWIIAFWKYYLRQGKLQIFRTGKIEVGHSNFGPSLALNGTLLSKNKEVFVSSMSIQVTRIKDNSQHILNWAAFRSAYIPIGKAENITIEIPSGFIVRPDSPYRYHIFFADTQVQKEIEPYLLNLEKEWNKFVNSKSKDIKKIISESGTPRQSILEQLYEKEFAKNSTYWQKAWDTLRSKVFWEPGKYKAKLEIETDKPNLYFEDMWNFDIEEESFKSFRLNAIATLREICLGNIDYFRAFSDYKNIV